MSLKPLLVSLLLSPGEFPRLLWLPAESSSEEPRSAVFPRAEGVCGARAVHAGHTPAVSWAPRGPLACAGGLGSDWAESSMCSFSAGHLRGVDVHLVCKLSILRAMSWSELCRSGRMCVLQPVDVWQAGREMRLNRKSQRIGNSSLLLSECFPHLSSKQRGLQNL